MGNPMSHVHSPCPPLSLCQCRGSPTICFVFWINGVPNSEVWAEFFSDDIIYRQEQEKEEEEEEKGILSILLIRWLYQLIHEFDRTEESYKTAQIYHATTQKQILSEITVLTLLSLSTDTDLQLITENEGYDSAKHLQII